MLLAAVVGVVFPLFILGGDPEPEPAVVAAVERAEQHEQAAEWADASYAWAEAFDRDPNQPEFMRRAGMAAWEAKNCPKAKRLLDAIIGEESLRSKDRHEAQDVLGEIEGQECAKLTEQEATDRARENYEAAESHVADDPARAAYEYEDAYYLVPGKHGFAYKVGTSAFEAKICSKAEQYLSHFSKYGDPEKHAEMMHKAEELLNRLETMGCSSGAPPPIAEKKGCAVSSDAGTHSAGLGWLFVLLGLGRRRARTTRVRRSRA